MNIEHYKIIGERIVDDYPFIGYKLNPFKVNDNETFTNSEDVFRYQLTNFVFFIKKVDSTPYSKSFLPTSLFFGLSFGDLIDYVDNKHKIILQNDINENYSVSPGDSVEWDLENNTTKITRFNGQIEWILQNEDETLPYLQKFFKTLSKDEIINFGKELYNKVSSGGNKRKIILMGLITAMINYGISKNDIVHEFDSNILNLLEPKNINIENKKEYVGNIDDFLNLLAFKESSGNWKKIRYSKKSGNHVYIGKYQFGKIALQDVGLDPEIINKFKDNPSVFPPELQEKVVKKLIRKNKKYLGK
jgi:hypothetical protein